MQIALAITKEKARCKAWFQKFESRTALNDEAKRILSAHDLSEATQLLSDFQTIIDPTDGCIHFVRASQGNKAAVSYNIDSMTVSESHEVAIAHYSGRMACAVRDKLLETKADELHALKR